MIPEPGPRTLLRGEDRCAFGAGSLGLEESISPFDESTASLRRLRGGISRRRGFFCHPSASNFLYGPRCLLLPGTLMVRVDRENRRLSPTAFSLRRLAVEALHRLRPCPGKDSVTADVGRWSRQFPDGWRHRLGWVASAVHGGFLEAPEAIRKRGELSR